MPQVRYFSYKNSQIENFLKLDFNNKFGSIGKISIRKRKKFIDAKTEKVSIKNISDADFIIDDEKIIY